MKIKSGLKGHFFGVKGKYEFGGYLSYSLILIGLQFSIYREYQQLHRI